MKIFFKALDGNGNCFNYLGNTFPALFRGKSQGRHVCGTTDKGSD
jgi:hypothetical protein